jgi:hypothetical protein
MTRQIPSVLVALVALLWITPTRASGQNQNPCLKGGVAVYQSRTVFAAFDSFTVKDTALATIVNQYKVDVARLNGVMDSAGRAYQEKAALLSAAARQVELKKLDAQNAVIQQRIRNLQPQVMRQREKLFQPILDGLQRMLDSVRSDLKCAVIIDASSGARIMSMNKSLDITQRIIDRIHATGDTTLFGPHPKLKGGP